MSDEIVNKVSQSGLITIDLETVFPEGERVVFDIKDCLVEGLLLREKDFRAFIKSNDWTVYKAKYVALFCSSDAIIPRWAWMLLAAALQPFAAGIVFGNAEALEEYLFRAALEKINPEDYRDQRVVIKGCGDRDIPAGAYISLTAKLSPVVKSIMYGEPCSTVPVFKRKED
jgi:hypothetical protein